MVAGGLKLEPLNSYDSFPYSVNASSKLTPKFQYHKSYFCFDPDPTPAGLDYSTYIYCINSVAS